MKNFLDNHKDPNYNPEKWALEFISYMPIWISYWKIQRMRVKREKFHQDIRRWKDTRWNVSMLANYESPLNAYKWNNFKNIFQKKEILRCWTLKNVKKVFSPTFQLHLCHFILLNKVPNSFLLVSFCPTICRITYKLWENFR